MKPIAVLLLLSSVALGGDDPQTWYLSASQFGNQTPVREVHPDSDFACANSSDSIRRIRLMWEEFDRVKHTMTLQDAWCFDGVQAIHDVKQEEPQSYADLQSIMSYQKPMSALVFPYRLADGRIWTGACRGCARKEYKAGRHLAKRWLDLSRRRTGDGVAGLHRMLDHSHEDALIAQWWRLGYYVRHSKFEDAHRVEIEQQRRDGYDAGRYEFEPWTYEDHKRGRLRYFRRGVLVNPAASAFDKVELGNDSQFPPPLPPAGTPVED